MSSQFTGTVIGYIGVAAKLKYPPNATPVANFSIAHNEKIGKDERVTWVNVAVFGKTAENISGYLTKGKLVAVTGRVSNRKYADREGTQKYSLELKADTVTLLGGGDKGEGTPSDEKAPF